MTERILPFVALVVAGLIIFLYIKPTYSGNISEARATIANDQNALAAAAEYKQKEKDLAAKKDSISAVDLARLAKLIPDSVNNVQVVLDLTAISARSGLSLSEIAVKNSSPQTDTQTGAAPNPIGSIDLTMNAAGTYQAFRTFLAAIEHSARLLDLENLTVTGSDNGVYTYAINLRLYWLRS